MVLNCSFYVRILYEKNLAMDFPLTKILHKEYFCRQLHAVLLGQYFLLRLALQLINVL